MSAAGNVDVNGPVAIDNRCQVIQSLHSAAVRSKHDITRDQTGMRSDRTRLDVGYQQPGSLPGTNGLHGDADPASGAPAQKLSDRVARYGESQTARDHTVDAYNVAVHVGQRSPRVAGRKTDIGADPIFIVRHGMDDAAADGSNQAERIA